MVTIRRATEQDAAACVAILRRLPDYFTPNTHEEARAAVAEDVAWVAFDGDSIEGFLIAQIRYPASAEITFAAVIPERQRSGLGTELVERAIGYLRDRSIAVVEVKTLDASSGYEPYVATRAFWEKSGFVQVDCIDPLPGWQPGNPSAFYMAALSVTAHGGEAVRRPEASPRPGVSGKAEP